VRIFLAVLFSSKVINQISALKESLVEHHVTGRFQKDKLLHMTLHFIGNIDKTQVPILIKAINDIGLSSFKLKTDKLDYFGKDNKTLYLGVEKRPELLSLHQQIMKVLEDLSFKIEPYVYTPHITIVRKAQFSHLSSIMIPKISFTVDKIVVMESLQIDSELIYRALN